MSYLEFYNLKEQPFSISVDNRFYYNSAQHAEALIRLKYAAEERKGFAILVGELGTGKTTLARRMLDELDGDKLITFIFFGLTDLDKYLALDEPLKQRIAVRYELRSFAQNATEEYIKFRLQKAGSKRELFLKDALNAIHGYTDGVPRLI